MVQSLVELFAQAAGSPTSYSAEKIEITPDMIEAGVFALRRKCPCDIAFPCGGEDEAVEAVLRAALKCPSV